MGLDIRVLGFKAKMNAAGKTVDYVEYAPAHAINTSINYARVKDLIPPPEFSDDRDPAGTKMFHMKAVWSQIAPHYEAWKKGKDMPETGMPLAAWPGVSEPEIFELNRAGIKSVEDVAAMSEGSLDKVALPNARDLRKQAQLFLENANSVQKQVQINELEEKLAAAMALLEEHTAAGAPPAEDVKTGKKAAA